VPDKTTSSNLARLKHDGWTSIPVVPPPSRSPELEDRLARLQARGRASTAVPRPLAKGNRDEDQTATVTFLTPTANTPTANTPRATTPPSETPLADARPTGILAPERADNPNGWLPGVATSTPMWRPTWSASRSVAAGASAVSFAAMVVAMGPVFEATTGSETATSGDPAATDSGIAGEQPAPAPSVDIQTSPVDQNGTAQLLPSADGSLVADPSLDAVPRTGDPANPAANPAAGGAAAAATAPPAAPAPAPADGGGQASDNGGNAAAPQPTAPPQSAAPTSPAPSAAPTTAAPATPPPTAGPTTAAPTTAAPTTAAPTTPAPTQPPPTTPPPTSGGSG
jgi:hypothetical protein